MVTFDEARRIVEHDEDVDTEPYGYESAAHWFPVIAPERTGGRVPAVAKKTGALSWQSGTTSDEFQSARVVGARP